MEFKKAIEALKKELDSDKSTSTARSWNCRLKKGLMDNKKKIELLYKYGYKRKEFSLWQSPLTGKEVDTIEAIRECLSKMKFKWAGTYRYRLIRDKLTQDKIHQILINNEYKPLTRDQWVKQ